MQLLSLYPGAEEPEEEPEELVGGAGAMQLFSLYPGNYSHALPNLVYAAKKNVPVKASV